MTILKSEHAKKRLEFYKSKVAYFQKQVAVWEGKYVDAKTDEANMLSGKMDGQMELPNPSACGTESGN